MLGGSPRLRAPGKRKIRKMVRFDIWLFNLCCVTLLLAATYGDAPPTPEPAFTPGPTNANPDDSTIRFAVIGDYGKDSANEGRVADLVSSWNPDFVITTGDNNYPDGAGSTIDDNIGKYYSQFIGDYQGSYGSGSSTNRFWPSLGNHDWHTISCSGSSCNGAYFDYFTLPNNERYYEVDLGIVHLFAIDSNIEEPDGRGENSSQASWLQDQLAASTSCYNLVYFHHAPYSSGHHGSNSTMQWPFPTWGADAVFSGHDHLYERLDVNGTPYFVNGAGGASLYDFENIGNLPPEAESMVRYNQDYGAMLVTVDFTGVTYQFYNADDTLIDEYTVTKNCADYIFADLSLSKTGVGGSAVAGGTYDYVLTVTNDGPDNSSGGTISDTLPPGWSFSSDAGGDCAPTSDGFECTVAALDVDESQSFTATVNVPADAPAGSATNTATVFGNEDTNQDNDTDSATTTIITATADLSISKQSQPDPVIAGERLTYTLAIQNTGPSIATGVVVTDDLPLGVNLVSATSSTGTCSITDPVICNIGGMNVSDDVVVTIVVDVDPFTSGLLVNSATVSGDQVDNNLANNVATRLTGVNRLGQLLLFVDDNPDEVAAGTHLTYTISITNSGPSGAANVVMTKSLPSEVDFVSVQTGPGDNCNESLGVLDCSFGNLAADENASVGILVFVHPATFVDQIASQAVVSGDAITPSIAIQTTNVRPEADQRLSKTGVGGSAIAGGTYDYILTITNDGPSNSSGGIISDTLPAGWSFNSDAGDDCTSTTVGFECTVGALTVNASQSFTAIVNVPADALPGLVTNSATVSGNEDTNSDNDTDSATTIITSDPIFLPIVMKPSISPLFISSNRADNSSFEGMSLIERP